MARPEEDAVPAVDRDRVQGWGALETLMILCHSSLGLYWAERDAGASLSCTVGDLAGGQYASAVAVYRAHEGRFDDVSEDVARAVLDALLESGWLFEDGLDRPRALPALVELHVSDADEIVCEARREARYEAAHVRSERARIRA